MKDSSYTNRQRFLHLKNLVENFTRTQKHLEEFGSILSDEKLRQVILKQRRREEQINNLQKAILNEYDRESEVRNLVKNFLYAEGYLNQNKDKLPTHMLNNLIKRQQFRKIQLENLIEKNEDE